jgi:hypothetical protein
VCHAVEASPRCGLLAVGSDTYETVPAGTTLWTASTSGGELVGHPTNECSSLRAPHGALIVDLNPTEEDQYGEDHDRSIDRRLESWNMTLGRYVESIVLSGLVIVSLGSAAVSLRRKSLPTWSGAPARLVEVIIAISLLVVVSQALGTVGLFRVGPLVIALVLVALLTFSSAKSGPATPSN